MIIAVGSDKGSPGATTLAVLLGLCWSGDRLVCEVDPCGADLPYRLAGGDGRPLAASPSIATLAVDARPGGLARPLELYAQQTALSLPVIAGEVSPRRFARLSPHLPAICQAAAGWTGTVIADVGRLQPWNPSLQLARTAAVVVLLVRADIESLGHLRDRVEELAADVGAERRLHSPVAVVVRAGRGEQRAAAGRVETLLASIGSPAPVVGVLADDRAAANRLWSGPLSRPVLRSRLWGSARAIVDQLRALAPELALAGPDTAAGQSPALRAEAGR